MPPKTETPRLEPGRSLQQGYCTTTVRRVKSKIKGKRRKVKTRGLPDRVRADATKSSGTPPGVLATHLKIANSIVTNILVVVTLE